MQKANVDEKINKVEKFLKERKVGIIEASMELITCRSYAVRPGIINFRITLPNERFLKLLPYKLIREKIHEINNVEDMTDWVDDETIKDLLTPNVWENYMARNSDLEELTFSQMVMEYQWWSSLSHVPAYWKRVIDKSSNFYEQWSFNKLKKYREDQDKIINIEESDISREMRRKQTKVCLDDKNQLAKYWYKKKNRSLFNWIYKLKGKRTSCISSFY